MIPLRNWNAISEHDKIGNIAAEILRASAAQDFETRQHMLERALALINRSLEDKNGAKSASPFVGIETRLPARMWIPLIISLVFMRCFK